MEIRFDATKFKSTIKALNEIKGMLVEDLIVQAMMAWAKLVAEAAQRFVPIKSGELRSDINYYLVRHTLSIITTKATTKPKDGKAKPYAFWLEFGTAPHWIAPKDKKVLHWIDPETGEDRFSKGHEVSGIKATRFMMRAYLSTRRQGELLLKEAVNKVMASKRRR